MLKIIVSTPSGRFKAERLYLLIILFHYKDYTVLHLFVEDVLKVVLSMCVLCVHVFVCAHTHRDIYNIYMYIYMYTYIHTHTHTHIHIYNFIFQEYRVTCWLR